MTTSPVAPARRTLITGLATLAATGFLSRPATAQVAARRAARFAEASSYSAQRDGVSLLIHHAGSQIHADWPGGGSPSSAWELASGTKSFSGVLAMLMVERGLLRLDELCAATLPEWRTDPGRRDITIQQLLTLTSGLPGRIEGGATMVPSYTEAVAARAVARPGQRFAYGPVAFQVFGEIARRKLASAGLGSDPLDFLQRQLFDPLQIRPLRWRRDQNGMPHLPSGAALTAPDWLKFGRMMMGDRQMRTVLSPASLAACVRTTPVNPGYGLTWWVPAAGMQGPGRRAGVADDMQALAAHGRVWLAAGAGNQRLYVLPDRQLVVVRQARGVGRALRGRGPDWSDSRFMQLIMADL